MWEIEMWSLIPIEATKDVKKIVRARTVIGMRLKVFLGKLMYDYVKITYLDKGL